VCFPCAWRWVELDSSCPWCRRQVTRIWVPEGVEEEEEEYIEPEEYNQDEENGFIRGHDSIPALAWVCGFRFGSYIRFRLCIIVGNPGVLVTGNGLCNGRSSG